MEEKGETFLWIFRVPLGPRKTKGWHQPKLKVRTKRIMGRSKQTHRQSIEKKWKQTDQMEFQRELAVCSGEQWILRALM